MAHKKSVGVAGTLERLGKICFQTCFWALTEKKDLTPAFWKDLAKFVFRHVFGLSQKKRLNPSILSDQVGTSQMKKKQD